LDRRLSGTIKWLTSFVNYSVKESFEPVRNWGGLSPPPQSLTPIIISVPSEYNLSPKTMSLFVDNTYRGSTASALIRGGSGLPLLRHFSPWACPSPFLISFSAVLIVLFDGVFPHHPRRSFRFGTAVRRSPSPSGFGAARLRVPSSQENAPSWLR